VRAKVLIVDDRRENLVALEAILQGLPVDPVSVSSGEEALKQLLEDDFAVILLDAQMPGMDGFAVAETIRRDPACADTMLVMLTSSGLRGDAARCRALGIEAYLAKPVRQAISSARSGACSARTRAARTAARSSPCTRCASPSGACACSSPRTPR
jgi:CheY-like chemotaxis protein